MASKFHDPAASRQCLSSFVLNCTQRVLQPHTDRKVNTANQFTATDTTCGGDPRRFHSQPKCCDRNGSCANDFPAVSVVSTHKENFMS